MPSTAGEGGSPAIFPRATDAPRRERGGAIKIKKLG